MFSCFNKIDCSVKKEFFYESLNIFFDIYIENKNIVVEYNGDYWHCNPKKYDYNYFNARKKKTAFEIWSDDKKRYEKILSKKIRLLVVWEKFYLINKNNIFSFIVDFINSNEEFRELNE